MSIAIRKNTILFMFFCSFYFNVIDYYNVWG